MSISVIIPTHNRRQSLMRLLHSLARQTFPSGLTEVIVVADGVNDDTLEHLNRFKGPFEIRVISLPGSGPATARNSGAAIAKNKILLFLDDDIEPSPGLLMAHESSHTNDQIVTVGYLPLSRPGKNYVFFSGLRGWWERKYYQMRQPGYRFSYHDLLSGNFAISASFFHKVGAFDTTFRCREDYELGARLIKFKADFKFVPSAWGYHHDERNNMKLTFKRKTHEGAADVLFGRKHPDLLYKLPLYHFSTSPKHSKQFLLKLAFNTPFVIKAIQLFGELAILLTETLRFRKLYKTIEYSLLKMYYLQGVAEAVGSKENFSKFMALAEFPATEDGLLKFNLANGIEKAEALLDSERPTGIDIYYNELNIGKLGTDPGSEAWRGEHLRPALIRNFKKTLLSAILIDKS